MFTGIIQALGSVEKSEKQGGDIRLTIACGELDLSRTRLGDSIAVNGACLTAIELGTYSFCADVSVETMNKTSLGDLAPGSPVNLEPALTLSDALGGHLVSGHVDGVGALVEMEPDARSIRYRFEIDPSLQHYIAAKGSVTVDGTSLTINGVEGNRFDVNIVPHTQQKTVFQYYQPGSRVNIEVDIIARYLERLLQGRADTGEELNSTQEIIDDIKAGKMVVIMDDEDRENEGDILMAAEAVTADHINFMAKHGRGLICLTLSEQRCKQLRLPLMVGDNRAAMETNFTVSIEAAEGVTTGISAADRATTIHAAIKPDATPESIVQPGHIFPVMARKGGVLFRAGHTEAGCDLARIAGFEPAAVIVEILNDDGSMARRKDLEKFAMKHGLKIGTIEDLIRYRIENEHTVERIVESRFPTDFGEFMLYAFEDSIAQELHLALVKGKVDPDKPIPVRVHVQNTLIDSLAGIKGRGWPLRDVIGRCVT
jgi:3,4-dihydroxy 2-butanone 4-phosphate synthase/GTP cyclohydrolase II